jgi:hypothetical protein
VLLLDQRTAAGQADGPLQGGAPIVQTVDAACHLHKSGSEIIGTIVCAYGILSIPELAVHRAELLPQVNWNGELGLAQHILQKLILPADMVQGLSVEMLALELEDRDLIDQLTNGNRNPDHGSHGAKGPHSALRGGVDAGYSEKPPAGGSHSQHSMAHPKSDDSDRQESAMKRNG